MQETSIDGGGRRVLVHAILAHQAGELRDDATTVMVEWAGASVEWAGAKAEAPYTAEA